MVLEKIEVQGSFQDGISAGIQKTIDKMGEFQVSTDAVTQALERLNKAKDRNTKASQSATQATADLVTSLTGLEDIAKEQRVTLHKIEVQTERTGKAFVKAGESINDTFSNEVRARIQNALDTMVEFGATIDDVEAASLKLSKAQMSGNKGMAQQANVLRTLVDESENAEFALANMGKATDIAAKAGIKLEDAGRQLGMAFRGDTTILKNFDEMAKKAATAIEKINDPAKRQVLIMKELAKAQGRVGGSFNRLQDSIASADVTLNKVGLSVKRLGLGLVGLIGAAGAAGILGAKKAVDAYIKSSPEMKRVNDELEKSTESLAAALGMQIARMTNLKKEMQDASDFSKGLAKDINNLGDEQNKTMDKAIALTSAILDLAGVKSVRAVRGLAKLRGEFGSVGENAAFASQQIFGMSSALDAMNKTVQRRMGKGLGGVIGPVMQQVVKTAKAEVARLKAAGKENVKTLKLLNEIEAKMFKIGKFAPGRGKKAPGGGGGGRGGMATKPLEDFTAFGPTSAELGGTFQQTIDSLTGDGGIGAAGEAFIKFQDALNKATPSLDGIGDRLRQQIDLAREMKEGYKDAGSALTQFANGGVTLASNSVSMLFENLASGQSVLANFGTFLLQSMGDLLGQMGQSFIMLGAGVAQIQTGLLSPGALIAIGVGMVALSGALKGFAARSQAGGSSSSAGGGTAQALERFGQRLFDRGDADQGREMTINIEGRSMRGFMLDVAADGARRGSVPLTPRRV